MLPRPNPGQSSTQIEPLHVLLVEDNPEYVLLVERALAPSSSPVEIDHVDTFGAALVRQERNPADVVLLDLGLPDSPADRTTKHLRHLARTASVFVLTERSDRSAALEALSSGAEDFFIKDQLDPNTLSSILQSAVARRRSGESRRLDRCMGSDEFRTELRTRIEHLGEGETMSLTIVELDDFDVLRETWGEPWAHRMLRSTAESLSRAAGGAEAIVARMGESSFAVLTAGDVDRAAGADPVDSSVTRSPDVSHRGHDCVTASYGTVRVPEDGRHSVSLVALAQQRASESLHGSFEGPSLRLESTTVDQEFGELRALGRS